MPVQPNANGGKTRVASLTAATKYRMQRGHERRYLIDTEIAPTASSGLERLADLRLHDVALWVTSSLSLDEVARRTLTGIGQLLAHDEAALLLVDDGDGTTVRAITTNANSVESSAAQFSIRQSPTLERMMTTCSPLLVADWESNAVREPYFELAGTRSLLGAPLVAQGSIQGFLLLFSRVPSFFQRTHGYTLERFAMHAAVAVQNARAYEQAQVTAAVQERQRLARDLHDAVSHTLYSANILAETLPRMWTPIPDRARQQLAQLQTLTHNAIAEMRAVLLDLRPELIIQGDLATQIRQLVNAFSSHSHITTIVNIQVEEAPPPAVSEALYRITQEALNNVTKHARASQVEISLEGCEATARLIIQDNGTGLNHQNSGMGILSMQERASAIGASFSITGRPGAGVRVTTEWHQTRE